MRRERRRERVVEREEEGEWRRVSGVERVEEGGRGVEERERVEEDEEREEERESGGERGGGRVERYAYTSACLREKDGVANHYLPPVPANRENAVSS
ncbi:hypothetical protein NHX12_001453 [Muraenolepis orangiensis]|uniref:Uncharacterized protein n=1 Tax=Muraenolepis orangiensis TaxID=630683 RepID=A0A9Q0E0X0_9TELE|nr:hypothetical protein NHX12_001453 [Muraenolepis orangiensis]